MLRRYLSTIAVVLAAVCSGAAYWMLSQPADLLAPRRIVRVAVSKSGRWIAAGAASGWIEIIDQSQPDSPQRFRGGSGALRDLRFSSDEKWLVVANDKLSHHAVESLGSLEPLAPGDDAGVPQEQPASVDLGERTSNLAAGPANTAVLGNRAGSIEIYHLITGALLRRFTFR